MPVDVFGNTISQAGVNYIDGTSWNDYHQQTWDITGNLQGTPFSDWAGAVAVATGFEVRRDFISSSADPGSIAKIWRINNTQPFDGEQKVKRAISKPIFLCSRTCLTPNRSASTPRAV